jgi:carboxypeptidase Taq
MNAESAYKWLRENSVKISRFTAVAELLAWDQRTHMPVLGHEGRAGQMAELAGLIHQMSTDARIDEYLEVVEGSDFVSDKQSEVAVNIRRWRMNFDRVVKIPQDLATAFAMEASKGETAWEKARADNDWNAFKPHLEELLSLSKQKADALGYENEPYDALLAEYEPGVNTLQIEELFTTIKNPLVTLLKQIEESSLKNDSSVLTRYYPVEKQREFCRFIVEKLGYNLNGGRIDSTVHPFAVNAGPGDVRITTRYFKNYLNAALFGCMHEAGHAMYEQGLPQEHFGTPRGDTVSLGIHESQSRLWENLVGRSDEFWEFAFPRARVLFSSLNDVKKEEFVFAINRVKPDFIRVEADEITYNLHILLRFEIELELLRGSITVNDVPEIWSYKMNDYLGIMPEKHSEGAMQDVHWSAGMFGYFPTYTLGNLYAVQLFNKAQKELVNLKEQFKKGEFSLLLKWLRTSVHSRGCTFEAADLIKEATGEALNPHYFTEYCKDKYSTLYNI